jgi:hypothetical protein
MSSSPGTGADMSPQEFMDVLHKLITESTKVQAIFSNVSGDITVAMQGFLKVAPDGRFGVIHGEGFSASTLLFNPALAVIRKWGDTRSFRVSPSPGLTEPRTAGISDCCRSPNPVFVTDSTKIHGTSGAVINGAAEAFRYAGGV